MKNRTGFTLVELVVVILILGILAGVAAPRMFDTAARATDNGLRQTLSVVRDAIELYTADPANPNPGNPPAFANSAAFQLLLAPYIRGAFPICPVGATGLAGTNTVVNYTVGTGTPPDPTDNNGAWRYDPVSGTFSVNYSVVTANDDDDGALTYGDL